MDPQRPQFGQLFDLRRKAQIVGGSPNDHGDEVMEMPMKGFDVSKTIFKTLDKAFLPMVEKAYAKELFWSDSAVNSIEKKAAEMLSTESRWANVQAHNPALIDFMNNECEFDCEHADGSFLDHLQFCYEYSAVHFPSHSPLVLFLHSIMGVGTNLFPMKLEQKERLEQLVTPDELAHLEAFPTYVRILQNHDLVAELNAMSVDELNRIDNVECCRLLGPDMNNKMKSDNAAVHLNGEQFWAHLNYHLIHFMDFLPASNWEENIDRFGVFIDLHRCLSRAGRLMAKVNFDSEMWGAKLDAFLKTEEGKTARGTQMLVTQNFSANVGHSLDYKVHVSEMASATRSML